MLFSYLNFYRQYLSFSKENNNFKSFFLFFVMLISTKLFTFVCFVNLFFVTRPPIVIPIVLKSRYRHSLPMVLRKVCHEIKYAIKTIIPRTKKKKQKHFCLAAMLMVTTLIKTIVQTILLTVLPTDQMRLVG